MSDALDLLHALVLDTGRKWGEVAADFQRADAQAIFSPDDPRFVDVGYEAWRAAIERL